MDGLHPEVNFQAYRERMAAVKDKLSLRPAVTSPTAPVLDVGCADGSLAPLFTPAQYLGYDLSSLMVEEAQQAHSAYRFTTERSRVEEEGPYSLILLSSILHEVYSYAPKDQRWEATVTFLRELKPLLAPQGVVSIRDGLQPFPVQEAEATVSYRLRMPTNATAFLLQLQEEGPWASAHRKLFIKSERENAADFSPGDKARKATNAVSPNTSLQAQD